MFGRCQHCMRPSSGLSPIALRSPDGDIETVHICPSCRKGYDAFVAAEYGRVMLEQERAS